MKSLQGEGENINAEACVNSFGIIRHNKRYICCKMCKLNIVVEYM